MNADSPNASSFVRATLIPTAAAARSFERTAMNIRPAGALRSRATSSPTRHDDDQHEDAEDHARVRVALRDPDVPAEDRRRRDRRARAARR